MRSIEDALIVSGGPPSRFGLKMNLSITCSPPVPEKKEVTEEVNEVCLTLEMTPQNGRTTFSETAKPVPSVPNYWKEVYWFCT